MFLGSALFLERLTSSISVLFVALMGLVLTLFQWWRDVIRESTIQGFHTVQVSNGLQVGFSLFILSEVMFFFCFFFAYFASALSPPIQGGGSWPPAGIMPVDYLGVPLGNTVLLLSSGVSITWAHYALLSSKSKDFNIGMISTLICAFTFLLLQGSEYWEIGFTISDSVYGSLFFSITGFHGIHVLVGGIFLSISFLRANALHFSSTHHLGFEVSAWYWHFVDVVWLFLFCVLYWWGS